MPCLFSSQEPENPKPEFWVLRIHHYTSIAILTFSRLIIVKVCKEMLGEVVSFSGSQASKIDGTKANESTTNSCIMHCIFIVLLPFNESMMH